MASMTAIHIATIESPIGKLTAAARGGRASASLHFGRCRRRSPPSLQRWYPEAAIAAGSDPGGAVSVLRRYFAATSTASTRSRSS